MINKKTEQEIENIKYFLKDYLEEKGFDLSKHFTCINPTHQDKHPSMSYCKTNNTIHCFSCGASYDIFQVVEIIEHLSKKEAFIFVFNKYGNGIFRNSNHILHTNTKENIDYSSFFDKCHNLLLKSENAISYLQSRGISIETIRKLNLGYCDSFDMNNKKTKVIIIPNGDKNFTVRNIEFYDNNNDKEYRIRKIGNSTLYNKVALSNKEKYCFVVEGEFDCLSFIENGYNAIALGSVNNSKLFIKESKNIDKFFILALDNDKAGQDCFNTIYEGLKQENKQCFILDYGNYKDPNEAFANNKSHIISQINLLVNNINKKELELKNAIIQTYLNNSCFEKMKGLKNYIEETKEFVPYTTGFTSLDTKLNGGLYEGLYVLGAISSLGKTSFALQIADNIAKNGKNILFFSLEMSSYELMAKSISRLTFENCMNSIVNKSTTDILYGFKYKHYKENELSFINQCMDIYEKYAKNIYILEKGKTTVNDIKNAVKEHIEITGNKPVVFIDYLQILSSNSEKLLSDKQIVDTNISELKRISREFHLPIVAISSVNRESYKGKIKMEAFKDSGGIEYSADVLLGLNYKNAGCENFDINNEKEKSKRELEVVILKNRIGVSGSSIPLEYLPKFNYFTDIILSNNICAEKTIRYKRNQNIF